MMKHALIALAVLVWSVGCADDEPIQSDVVVQGAFCNQQCSPDPVCTAGHYNLCNSACVDLWSSQTNCGACGQACTGATVCQSGRCVSSGTVCLAGQTACGTQCAILASDPAHCGDCNVSCGAGQSCVTGKCVCPGVGQQFCDNSCVDTKASSTHCGTCGNACADGKSCVNGECGCAVNQQLCAGACVDTKTDSKYCGSCSVSCKNGKTCQAGTCVCPSDTQLCGTTCADTTKDAANCGACGKKCTGGEICSSGTCKCAEGQSKCNNVCADITKDPKNCGKCGELCYGSETCDKGRCAAAIGADGCNGAVEKLTLTDLAAYQAIKIPLAKGQTEVAKASRPADIIQGHETLFRFFVKPDSGWTAHKVSARVTVTNGTNEDQYFAYNEKISKASTDADANSTFQVAVPAKKITGETAYSAEIVECGTEGTGTGTAARFPATGTAKLSATKTGVVKISYIPVLFNNLKPDIAETTLAKYNKYLQAMYPTSEIKTSIGKEMTAQASFFGLSWSGVLDQLRSKRNSENAPNDTYYFALIKPAANFQTYCRSGCTLGISYVAPTAASSDSETRVAMGAAFTDTAEDVEMTAATIAHELGHSHGQSHAPCADGGTISGVDGNYPTDNAHKAGNKEAGVGVWGYDGRNPNKFIDPTKTLDIMSYCRPQWISDYTFKALTKRVSAMNTASFELRNAALQAKWRVLLLDSTGTRWGIPIDEPKYPYGQAEDVTIFDASGSVLKKVTGYRTLIASGNENAAMVLVPEPETGWAAVQAEGWPAIAFPVTP